MNRIQADRIEAAQTYSPRPVETITESLFDSKDRTISEADIQRLLNGDIKLPDTIRIAIILE